MFFNLSISLSRYLFIYVQGIRYTHTRTRRGQRDASEAWTLIMLVNLFIVCHLPRYTSISIFIHPSIYLSIYISIYLSIYLSISRLILNIVEEIVILNCTYSSMPLWFNYIIRYLGYLWFIEYMGYMGYMKYTGCTGYKEYIIGYKGT